LSRDQKLGILFLIFAVFLVFVWIPLDVDTWYIEKVRRQVSIGDALAPTVAGVFLLIGGIGFLVFGGTPQEIEEPTDFVALLFVVYFISFLVMLFAVLWLLR